jgi:hypothetical protein
MTSLIKISVVYIYVVSIFGIINIITHGLKSTPNSIIFFLTLVLFSIQLFYQKKLWIVNVLIAVFALLSSIGFSLFISDIIYHPIAIADDCEGHKPNRTHYFDIIIVGFSITLLFSISFIKKHIKKGGIDSFFSGLIILTLVLCYLQIPFFKMINKKISEVSQPRIVLPKGC